MCPIIHTVMTTNKQYSAIYHVRLSKEYCGLFNESYLQILPCIFSNKLSHMNLATRNIYLHMSWCRSSVHILQNNYRSRNRLCLYSFDHIQPALPLMNIRQYLSSKQNVRLEHKTLMLFGFSFIA